MSLAMMIRRFLPPAAACIALLSGVPSQASGNPSLDSRGDGISDLWRQLHPGAIPGTDSDGDGFTDDQEAIAGTNPFNPTSKPAIDRITRTDQSVTLNWSAVVGKYYAVEKFQPADGSWIEINRRDAGPGGPAALTFDLADPSAILRMRVGDVDADGDGLNAWEEAMLGFSDATPRSSGQTGRNDYAAAFRTIEGQGTFQLADGRTLQKRGTTPKEAARFLSQASFGADIAMIQNLAATGIGPWLDSQIHIPATSSYSMMFSNGQTPDAFLWRKGWWRTIMLGQDQLRQRVAYALSQIFVINCDIGSRLGDNPLVQGRYYDILINRAFSNYRPLLEDITYSPQMGYYLSHLRNRKSDPALNRFPDENFAREIMQLFTIGLWELNQDGSQKTDAEGIPFPTYDNSTITEMAKVFTGMSFGTNGGSLPNESFFTGGVGNDFIARMKMFDDQHEPGEKHIIGNITIPNGQTGDQDVAATLDSLCNHPNIAPFISRLLIQRFTSSNPSPDYIRRVAEMWHDNGAGTRGDLQAVIEAILLDSEARTPASRGDQSGKVREPLLRLTNLLRAFNARNSNNSYPIASDNASIFQPLGQFTLLSPSVFNFYSPDHIPAGEPRARSIAAPELEIATTSRLLATDNLLRHAIDSNFSSLALNFSPAFAFAGDTDALIDHCNLLLAHGSLSEITRSRIRTAIDAQPTAADRIRTAAHLIVEAPESIVLK